MKMATMSDGVSLEISFFSVMLDQAVVIIIMTTRYLDRSEQNVHASETKVALELVFFHLKTPAAVASASDDVALETDYVSVVIY